MKNIEVLKNLEKDYDIAIEQLHQMTMDYYAEMATIRNKRTEIRKLIKNLSKK